MDTLIINGEIIDGTGSKGFYADILIRNDKISKIGIDLLETIDKNNINIIDAKGLVVAPGFIDMHSHSDATILKDRTNEEKLQQGITTEVNGNCGFGLYPITKNEDDLGELIKDLVSVEFFIEKEDLKWNDFESFSRHYVEGFGTNQVPLVAHGAIRNLILGVGDKPITESYLINSKIELEKELNAGCWGMSTGLAYTPGCFSTYDELKNYCLKLKEKNKLFISHMRNEDDGVLDSIDEIISLASETGCRAHISHLKAIGVNNHYKNDIAIDKISKARERGVQITADIYPYNASCTMLSVLLPNELKKISVNEMCEKLRDLEFCKSIREKVAYNLEKRGGGNKVIINYHSYNYKTPIVGKSIKEIAEIFNLDEIDTIFKLISDCENTVTAIYYSISDEGIIKLMNEEFIVFGTDGTVNFNNKEASHPRTYGSFPKILSKYVRDLGVISLESAIQKMTYNTANIVGLENRGAIKEGYFADIVIFDKDKIKDNSTFENAHQFATGINYVLVNGKISYRDGEVSKELNGKILKSI